MCLPKPTPLFSSFPNSNSLGKHTSPTNQTKKKKSLIFPSHPVPLLCGTYHSHNYVIIWETMNVVVVTPGPKVLCWEGLNQLVSTVLVLGHGGHSRTNCWLTKWILPLQRTERKWKCWSLSCVQLFYDPIDWSQPGSSVHGISQERILEWVAIPLSRRSSWPRDRTLVSCIAGRFFTIWSTRELGLYKQGLCQTHFGITVVSDR